MEKVKILMVLSSFVLACDAHSLECSRCRCCNAGGCNSTGETCLTGCKDGYFGRRCWNMCPSHCVSCGREVTVKAQPTYNICYKCTDGYYNGTGVTNCSTPCPINCYKCSSATNCSECKSGFYKRKGGCAATTPCPINCYKCSSATNCSECKNGFYERNGGCVATTACPEVPATDVKNEILSYTGTAVGGMAFSAALIAMYLCITRRKRRNQTNEQKPDTTVGMNTLTCSVSLVGLHNYEKLKTNDGVTEHSYDTPIVNQVQHNYENAKIN